LPRSNSVQEIPFKQNDYIGEIQLNVEQKSNELYSADDITPVNDACSVADNKSVELMLSIGKNHIRDTKNPEEVRSEQEIEGISVEENKFDGHDDPQLKDLNEKEQSFVDLDSQSEDLEKDSSLEKSKDVCIDLDSSSCEAPKKFMTVVSINKKNVQPEEVNKSEFEEGEETPELSQLEEPDIEVLYHHSNPQEFPQKQNASSNEVEFIEDVPSNKSSSKYRGKYRKNFKRVKMTSSAERSCTNSYSRDNTSEKNLRPRSILKNKNRNEISPEKLK
jgi:hypothetical protein